MCEGFDGDCVGMTLIRGAMDAVGGSVAVVWVDGDAVPFAVVWLIAIPSVGADS